MEADPEFHPYHGDKPSSDEQKRRAARQLARLNHQKFLPGNISKLNYRNKVFSINSMNFFSSKCFFNNLNNVFSFFLNQLIYKVY